jgi:hypothetical protein
LWYKGYSFIQKVDEAGSAGGVMQQITLGSASANTTSYTELLTGGGDNFAPSGDTRLPAQAAILGGSLNAASSTATLQFVLMDSAHSEIRRRVVVTATTGTVEDHPDGSTGTSYSATFSPASVDLAGVGEPDPDTGKPLKWYTGPSAYATATGGRLDVTFVRNI